MSYEYKAVEAFNANEIASRANAEGSKGWRLVAVEKDSSAPKYVLIMERVVEHGEIG